MVAVTAAGAAGALGQILVVRELLVLFHGNELSTGIIFTAWMAWTALGAWAGRRMRDRAGPGPLAAALGALALLLPATLLLIRGARPLWGIPPGEVLAPTTMLAVSVTVTAAFCLAAGLLFSLAWAVRSAGPGGRPLRIYLGEAIGAALGGLAFHFLLLPHVPVLTAALLSASILAAAAAGLTRFVGTPAPRRRGTAAGALLLAGLLTALAFEGRLADLSRRWQWGPNVVAAVDTPFHNLALVREEGLATVFANGLWLFSAPDPRSAELAVHPALLQHPAPRTVLLIGGGVAGLVREILAHPSVERIDYVEPDPKLIRLARRHLPPSATTPLGAPRVRLIHQDAGAFVRRTDRRYDAVLMNVGDPMNAEMNRFYTLSFFRRIRDRLAAGPGPPGIFSFSVSSAQEMLGPAQIRYLRSVDATLGRAFPKAILLPGETARFVAGSEETALTLDPDLLIDRMAARGLHPDYARPDYFTDLLNPFRLDYFRTVLGSSDGVGDAPRPRVNRDFSPTCYFHNLVLWSTQVEAGLAAALLALSRIPAWAVWAAATLMIFLILALVRTRPDPRRPTIALCVAATGAAAIVSQVALLLGFQILAGFVYRQLALIIALFMAGLALGTAWADGWSRGGWAPGRTFRGLLAAQTAWAIFPLALMGALLGLRELLAGGDTAIPIGVPFSALALAAGTLGGAHFSLAVLVMSGTETASATVGGGLYAVDLVGAGLGALAGSLFLIPVHGLPTTLGIFALLEVGGVAGLVLFRGR